MVTFWCFECNNHYELETLKKEFGISSNLKDLFDDDFVVALELSLLAFNIRREVCGVLDGFLSFFKKYEKNKTNVILYVRP